MLVISVVVIASSGAPGLLLSRRNVLGQWVATVLNLIGALLGGVALVFHYRHPEASSPIALRWGLPLGRLAIGLDDLNVIFLIPILLIPALGSVYGLSYWSQREHASNGRKLRFCWGLMTAGMALVVLSRDGVLFLVAWEVMALAAFFLVATEDDKAEVREAGWVYLVPTHVGTLCLFGFFALLWQVSGSFDLWPTLPVNLSPDKAIALFSLGALGFGLKAGLIPVHVWLPGAHANAPSHVSAVLSGVLLKTGVYGLVRVAALTGSPPLWWGATLLVTGGLSALLGIAFAAGQRDLKRLLAYSSIENVGIIVLGIGLATLGRSLGRADWMVLGLGGALLHILNHSLFKPLLFMGAGGILHAARTRQLDLLGGLGQRMPISFAFFLVGVVAICGLPPLNGFVGELLLYLGLFKTVASATGWGWVGLAAPALALVGAMAIASFVKLLGIAFAGHPRSVRAAQARDPDRRMLVPMGMLAGCCILIGVLPQLTVGLLDREIAAWALPHTLPTMGSLNDYVVMVWLSAIAVAILAVASLGVFWLLGHRLRTMPARAAGTWDCGYARPTARMQYSGSSFSQMLVELLSWIVWPRHRSVPRIHNPVAAPADFESEVPDVVLDRGLLPALGSAEEVLERVRALQRGPVQVYLLYVLGILLLLLLLV
jgi:hydrogenase-4 component B